jgi:2-dehydropantoate 2-reductase
VSRVSMSLAVDTRTRIAVTGAGAVGCYYGGMLARAGHDVVLIGRSEHVRAIERDGLRLEAHGWDERVHLSASAEASAVSGANLVLFCVKSTDTEPAAAQMRTHLAPDAVILTLQNGVDNGQRLRALLPQVVATAVVYVATEMAGPGHVRHHGRGELVIERFSGSHAVQQLLIEAGVPTEISDNVRGALWTKLILNCAYNALSAIARLPYGPLVQGDGVSEVMRDVVAECLAVARADGVQIAGDVDAAVRQIARTMPAQYSSTSQDLARGKRSEIDHLNGFVVRRGEALGVATPVNRVLHALVKLLESSRPPMCAAREPMGRSTLSAAVASNDSMAAHSTPPDTRIE